MNTVLYSTCPEIVSQTDIYTVLCRRLIEFHNETKLFVPPSDAELGCRIYALQDRRPDFYSEMKIRFVTKPIFLFPYNLILLPAGSIFQALLLQDYRTFRMFRRPGWQFRNRIRNETTI